MSMRGKRGQGIGLGAWDGLRAGDELRDGGVVSGEGVGNNGKETN